MTWRHRPQIDETRNCASFSELPRRVPCLPLLCPPRPCRLWAHAEWARRVRLGCPPQPVGCH
eukprot:scaffold471584_cov17-Prasinocladus_malaysianus.AAC.1